MEIKKGYSLTPFYYLIMVYIPIIVAIVLNLNIDMETKTSILVAFAGIQLIFIIFLKEYSVRNIGFEVIDDTHRLTLHGINSKITSAWEGKEDSCNSCNANMLMIMTTKVDTLGVINIHDEAYFCPRCRKTNKRK